MFLVEYAPVNLEITLKRYFRDWSFKALHYRDSKPSSSKSFSLDGARMASIMASTALLKNCIIRLIIDNIAIIKVWSNE